MALAITPRGEFGDLQGFKSRRETLARAGPHRRAIFLTTVGLKT